MHKTILYILLIFLSNAKGQNKGPVYIKHELTKAGVFMTPKYEFTTDYDNFNQSDSDNKIRGLLIKGLPFSFANNEKKETKVFCWYGEPDGIQNGEKRPAVILVHGGGGKAFTKWVDKWNDRGYIAIALSLEGQIPNKTNIWEYSGPKRDGFFKDIDRELNDQWFYHAVADIILTHSLLRDPMFSNKIDVNHIGITGISWGGILTNVATGIDDRFDFSIPVYGCGYLYDSPVYSNQLTFLPKSLQKYYLENWDPSLYIPLQTQPTLFINGTNDLQFTMNIFTNSYNASNTEKYLRIEHNMRHGHAAGWSPKEIYNFADYITNNSSSAIQPLKFINENANKANQVSYTYSYQGQIDEAILYYTNDTITWKKDEYSWTGIPANLTKKEGGAMITATLPKNTQAYFINLNDKHKNYIFSSSMKFTHAIK